MRRWATPFAAVLLATSVAAAGAWARPPGGERWAWPLDGEVLNRFSYGAEPFAPGQHRGIDIGASVGTPVRAAAGGTVTFAGTVGSAGLTAAVRTADDRYDVTYLHLRSVAVGPGDRVDQGEPIGTAGTSGRGSVAAPHLHLGVRRAGSEHAYVDPLRLLAPRGGPGDGGPRAIPVRGPAPVVAGRWRAGRVRALRSPAEARPSPAWRRLPARGGPLHGWAIACGALLLGAAALACGWWRAARTAAGRPSAGSIGVRAVLRHHADLLRQR